MTAGARPPGRRGRRPDRGATTVEYVGLAVVITAIIGALVALTTPVGSGSGTVVDQVFCRLSGLVGGGGGCGAADSLESQPPTKCTVSRDSSTRGGSVTVFATIEADSGHEIREVRVRNPDGSISTEYIVRTKGQVGADYTLRGGGSAEVSTGTGGGDAGAGLRVKVGADGAWGRQYTVDSLEEAHDLIDSLGTIGSFTGSEAEGHEADATYFDIGAQVTGSGQLGPLDADGSGAVTLGAQSYANGDTRVRMALTAKAAADLGVPLPDQVLALQAEGDAELTVLADVTFDDDGAIAEVGGRVIGTIHGRADIGANTDAVKDLPVGSRATIKEMTLPPLLQGAEGGYQFRLDFSTDFRRGDALDHSAVTALSDGLRRFVNTGQGLTEEQQATLREQLNEHSQVTFDQYTVDKEEREYGGKVSVLFVNIGGEVHEVEIDSDLIGSHYYDPADGSWKENTVCD